MLHAADPYAVKYCSSLASFVLCEANRVVYSCVTVSLSPCVCVCAVREAVDACWWLIAAGFPQYVQLFEGKYSERNGERV